MRIGIRSVFLVLVAALSTWAQFQPASSKSVLFFPQLADGGPAEQRWQTMLTFTNSSPLENESANVLVRFYNDSGGPLALDFGEGARSEITFAIPPNGIRVMRSLMASASTVAGWAVAYTSRPIQGSLSYRMYSQGKEIVQIAAHSTPASYSFLFPATQLTGVAVVNPNSTPITVLLTLKDQAGTEIGEQSFPLPPGGHTTFNVWQKFTSLPHTFVGTLLVDTADMKANYFSAWALGVEGALLYSLPGGEFGWPPDHQERIRRTWQKIRSAANRLTSMAGVQLEISPKEEINAWATPISGQDKVTMTLAASEFMGDSDGELAALMAHEFGHVVQFRTGARTDELDADRLGTLLLFIAGYDPYAMLGTLGRLQAAAGDPSLRGQLLREYYDSHGSFPTRIATVLDTLKTMCSYSAEMQTQCQLYKSLIHPHFPDTMPLRRPSGQTK